MAETLTLNRYITAATAFASHAGDRYVDPQPEQTYVVKTDGDSSTVKRLAISMSVTCPRR